MNDPDDRREARRNFHAVLQLPQRPLAFESYFQVDVVYGDVKVPALSGTAIRRLGPARPVEPGVIGAEAAPQAPSTSIPILFVAGDRGGTHRNQIQTPREFHAIQDALLGCKHREAMSLATPILAATHERIAQAYRQRPAILHFAGHGDHRTLSVIQDEGALVNAVPLDAESLITILGNFTERIRLCVLNACESAAIAQGLVARQAVDAAIGWSGRLPDSAAITFSQTLYASLGDGVPLERAITLAGEACGQNPVMHATPTTNTKASFFDVGMGV